MRILQIIPVFSDPFGGPVTVVRSISKELAKRHEVTVYTTTALDSKHDIPPNECEKDGYKIIYFDRSIKPLCYSELLGPLNFSFEMARAIKNHISEFDVVHVHSWQQFPEIIVHHYAIKYRIPYTLQVHGSLTRIGAKKKLKLLYDILLGYQVLMDASKLIALHKVEAEQYKAIGIPEEKIDIIPNGIDLSEYANLPPKGYFKKKFGIPEEKKIILYLGRIHKTKGIDFLIKAYAHLTKRMGVKGTALVIAGPDDGYLNEAKVLVKSLNIAESVIFTGFIGREDKLKALVDAEVFVTPSFYGFPVTFLEACATGVPIVTTSMGDSLEWIDGKAGYVSKPSVKDFTEKICTILNKEIRKNISNNCLNLAKEFSIEKVVCKLERVYKEVLNRQN
ncbi:MAG: glycosyltransferase [Candidatus Methanomethyliaceae archaeon]